MWTPSALEPELRAFSARVVRLVEAQHQASTMRLAATIADQLLLEQVADAVKPSMPAETARLPWLLAGPFRYGHRSASRFRAAGEKPGIFYAATSLATAAAEAAYWRLRALAAVQGAPAPLTRIATTLFSVQVRADRALDLLAPPLNRDFEAWTHPGDSTATQALARAARTIGTQALRGDPAHEATVTFDGTADNLTASSAFPPFSARYRLTGGIFAAEG